MPWKRHFAHSSISDKKTLTFYCHCHLVKYPLCHLIFWKRGEMFHCIFALYNGYLRYLAIKTAGVICNYHIQPFLLELFLCIGQHIFCLQRKNHNRNGPLSFPPSFFLFFSFCTFFFFHKSKNAKKIFFFSPPPFFLVFFRLEKKNLLANAKKK